MSCLVRSFAWIAAVCVVAAGAARAGQVKIGGRTFTVPEGFTVELVAGPELVERPIVGDFDESGRLYVADSSGSSEKVQKQLAEKPHRIVRLDASDETGRFARASVFAPHMMFPEGVMCYGGSVYVGAPPSIWKLTAVDGTGLAKQEEEWLTARTLTGCANDIHGPYLGPDGWIYWCKGAFAEQTYARPGKTPMVSRAAHIFRARPDGTGLEPVMTGGMDNPVHVVWTPGGERIFTTTFLQQPGNGKRDGIIHAVYGGIYGKVHDVIDDHPHTSPDVMPVLVHLGPAAACGLCRYESDAFGPPYRDNLFATSFNLHKVTRHVLKPEGATFDATNEDFVACDDVDFHPTDVIEDADGSLLVIDTGGWYKLCCPTSQFAKPDVLGAIYRVRRAGAGSVEDARGLRIDWAGMDAAGLAKLLDDPRVFVRRRAVQTLANRAAVDELAKVIASGTSARARINAVWAATRIEGDRARKAARPALGDPDETVRQVAAHSAGAWRDAGAYDGLVAMLESSSAHNRRVAAEALGRIGIRRAVPRILAKLADPNDRVLDHSLAYALIDIGDAKATRAGLAAENPRVRRAAMIALDQMDKGGISADVVAANLSAPDANLRRTVTWIAGRHAEWGQTLREAFARRLAAGQDDGQLADDLAKLARSEAIAGLLAERLADQKISAPQRKIVLRAMSESGISPAPRAWLDSVRTVLRSSDAKAVADVAEAAPGLRIKAGADGGVAAALLAVAGDEKMTDEVRLEAFAAIPGKLAAPGRSQLEFLVAQLRSGTAVGNRLLAAQAVSRSKLSEEQLLSLAGVIGGAGALEIGPVLEAFAQSSDEAVGTKLVEALEGAKAAGALRADAVERALSKFGADVKSRGRRLAEKLNPDSAAQQARLDQLLITLPSGDVRRGQAIFNSAKAACYSCHQIGYVGGHVGPDLTKIGAIRTRRDLLESVVFPSASFVQSFEPTMVILTNGDRQYGIVRRNDASEVMVVTGPNQDVHVARKDVAEMRPGTISVMPAGFADQLSGEELADLVAFLGACK
jgi:putative membrane-bound dehydrogenase-like protein